MIRIDIGSNNKFEPWSKDFWIKILVMTLAICIVSFLWGSGDPNGTQPYIENPLYAIILALVISILNSFIKPILSFFSVGLIITTFGFFSLIINAIIIELASLLMGPHFNINGFGNAFIFSILVAVLSIILDLPRRLKKVGDLLSSKHDPYRENNPNRNETTYTDYEDVTDKENE